MVSLIIAPHAHRASVSVIWLPLGRPLGSLDHVRIIPRVCVPDPDVKKIKKKCVFIAYRKDANPKPGGQVTWDLKKSQFRGIRNHSVVGLVRMVGCHSLRSSILMGVRYRKADLVERKVGASNVIWFLVIARSIVDCNHFSRVLQAACTHYNISWDLA